MILQSLIKFGSEKNIIELRDKGLIYMKNLPYFWKIENDELRKDPCDGVDTIDNGINGVLLFQNTNRPVCIQKWNLKLLPNDSDKINIFCMFALRTEPINYPIDDRNVKFGNFALIITDPAEFIQRVHSHLCLNHVKHEADLVKYLEFNHKGEVGLFKKKNSFSYQSEWRLVCYNGPGNERRIEIGSLSDIADIVPSCEINDRIIFK